MGKSPVASSYFLGYYGAWDNAFLWLYLSSLTDCCDRVSFKLIKGLIVSAHLSKLLDVVCNGLCAGAGRHWSRSYTYYPVFSTHHKGTSAGRGRIREISSHKPFSSEHTLILFCWFFKVGISPFSLDSKVTFTVSFVKGTILGYWTFAGRTEGQDG